MVEKLGIPVPLPKPRDLGRDVLGRNLGDYTPREFALWREQEGKRQARELLLRGESTLFRERRARAIKGVLKGDQGGKATEEEIEEEKVRRREIGQLRGKGTLAVCKIPEAV